MIATLRTHQTGTTRHAIVQHEGMDMSILMMDGETAEHAVARTIAQEFDAASRHFNRAVQLRTALYAVAGSDAVQIERDALAQFVAS